MARIPTLSASDIVRTFQALGWEIARTGNHIVLVRDEHTASLAVPNHPEVAKGTLRGLIRTAGLTVQEFTDAIA